MTAGRDTRREAFGTLSDGRTVERLRIGSLDGIEAEILTYGGILQALRVPDAEGRLADVTLGHDTLDGYEATRGFFGATIGRYANRIAAGRFTLDGREVRIAPNDGPNALHGGADGFDRQVWDVEEAGADHVRLARVSPDGESGFPGTLSVALTYRIVDAQTLEIAFEASTDRATVVNLTNHTFFNLGGAERCESVLPHELTVAAERYLPIDATSIPEGSPAPVAGTPFDFRQARPIGERVRDGSHEQIRRGRGYDHNFCLADAVSAEPRLAARVRDPLSGRAMELWTDQPGLQIYSGNFLDGTVAGKNGRSYRMGDALCLEPQLWPDTPNRPDFPSARLDAGETYRHRTLYKFSTT